MTIIIEFILAALLLGASAFFSAAETALVSLSSQKAKHLALRNPALMPHLLRWLRKPHELIIAILIGNTLAVVMFATIVTSIMLNIFNSMPMSHVEVMSWVCQSIGLVILGEITPKFYARIHPERTSLFVLPLLSRMLKILRPIAAPFSRLIEWVTPSLANAQVNQLLTFSLDELRSLLEEDQSLTMMQKAIEINNKTVHSIMTPLEKVDYVDLSGAGKAKLDRDFLIDLIIENGHSRTPVKNHGRFVGYIHAHDLLPLILEDRNQPLEDLVVPALDVLADTQVSDLLQRFKMSDIHVGFVRSGSDIVGLVTLEDVMEEITGEILDEFDVSQGQQTETA